MPTIHQLVKGSRKPIKKQTTAPALHWIYNAEKNQTLSTNGSPQKTRCLYPRLDGHPEEA